MKDTKEFEIAYRKESNRVVISSALLAICFTLFTFLIAVNPNLLKENIFLTLQLVLSIPFFTTSLLVRTKTSYTLHKSKWTNFGFITYILAYTFLINVVGISLAIFISVYAALIFFISSIVLALVYSSLEIYYDQARFKERILKDAFFVLILVVLGILPALRVY